MGKRRSGQIESNGRLENVKRRPQWQFDIHKDVVHKIFTRPESMLAYAFHPSALLNVAASPASAPGQVRVNKVIDNGSSLTISTPESLEDSCTAMCSDIKAI